MILIQKVKLFIIINKNKSFGICDNNFNILLYNCFNWHFCIFLKKYYVNSYLNYYSFFLSRNLEYFWKEWKWMKMMMKKILKIKMIQK